MTELNQNDWREQQQDDTNFVIIDVRTDDEMEEGFIPGAQQMNIQDTAKFYADAKQLDSEKSYYIYCRSGSRSAQACMLFNSLGIEKTYNLIGGISEWDGEVTQ